MQNVSPRVPPRFSVILVQFSRGESPRAAFHDLPICADLFSFGKLAGFTLLFACDNRTSLTWRVFDTHARVRTRAVQFSRKSHVRCPPLDACGVVATADQDGRRRWKSRAIRWCSMSVATKRSTSGCVAMCMYMYVYMYAWASEWVCARRRRNVMPRRRDANRAATRRSREDRSPVRSRAAFRTFLKAELRENKLSCERKWTPICLVYLKRSWQ